MDAGVAEKGTDGAETRGVVLETDVVLEPGAVVEAGRVGEGTVLEAGSKAGAGAILGKVSLPSYSSALNERRALSLVDVRPTIRGNHALRRGLRISETVLHGGAAVHDPGR